MDLQQKIQKLFESITSKNNVFYKSQQKDENDLDNVQKMSILRDLFQRKPNAFLERYHQYIEPEFIALFDPKGCEEFYLERIKAQAQEGLRRKHLIKNYRYLAMQELRREGSYFSNEKMREREPYLFETMVERYMSENEKLQLRPTVEVSESGSEFSKLLDQFDSTQRVSDRRRRYLEEFQTALQSPERTSRFLSHVENRTIEADEEEQEMGSDFTMEFGSSDEEGKKTEQSRILQDRIRHRHCAKKDDTVMMRCFRDRNAVLKLKAEDEKAREALSTMHITKKLKGGILEGEDESSSGNEFDSEPTGLLRDQLYEEFVSLMEQRFLDGEDVQFFDYSQVDAGFGLHGFNADKIYEQDMEDAYFDSEEPD